MKPIRKLMPLLSSGVFRGLGAVSQLILAAWVAHRLSKEDSGQFLFYLSCFTVASPMLLFGTQQFAMRHLSQYGKITSEMSRDSLTLAWLSGRSILIALVALLPLAWVLDFQWDIEIATKPIPGQWTFLVVNSLLGSACLAIAAHFHGARKLAWSLFLSHIGPPSISVALFAMTSVSSVEQAVLYHGVGCLITLVIGTTAWAIVFRPFSWLGRELQKITSLAACLDLWLLNTFILIVNWSPLIIGGFLLSADRVAELNIAQRAANLINFLLIVAGFAFAPQFRFAWAQQDLLGLRRMVSRCSFYLIVLGTPLAVVVIGGAPWIMAAFGSEYVQGAMLLSIFAAAQYFNVITGTVNQVLTMCNHERTLRNICLFSSITSFSLGLILVIQFGAVGAAVAAAVAVILQNILAVLAVKRLLGFWVFDIRSPRTAPA